MRRSETRQVPEYYRSATLRQTLRDLLCFFAERSKQRQCTSRRLAGSGLNPPLENAGRLSRRLEHLAGKPVIRDHPLKNFKLPALSARNSRTKTATCRHYPNAKHCNAPRQNSGEIEGAVALRALHRSGLISEGGSSCTWDEQRGRKRASKIAYKLHSQFS